MSSRAFRLASWAISVVLAIAIFVLGMAARTLGGHLAEFCTVAGCGMLLSSWLRYAELRTRALRRREQSELRAWATLDCGHSIEILHRAALKTSPGDLADCHWCGDMVRRVDRVRWSTEDPSIDGEEDAA